MKRFLILCLVLFLVIPLWSQNADQIVKKAYYKTEGQSQYAYMEMKIIRPSWTRTIKFKFVSEGTKKALVLITSPANERGQTFLLYNNQLWMYNPTINSLIKLGPSMLSQGWMGSDYSNDQLLHEGSIIDDYTHKIIGSEQINGHDCWKILLTPKKNSSVVWGKQILWIDKHDFIILKQQLFDQDGYLVKTQTASAVKVMDGRKIPTVFTVIPNDNPDQKTVMTILQIKFNIRIPKRFFSLQNMRKGLGINFNF